MKWIPITQNYELKEMAIVTGKINGNQLDVTIGFPGWGLQNGTIAYMPLPKNINEDPTVWKSEYRGDDLPAKKGWFIVNLQGIFPHNQGKSKIDKALYLPDKGKWFSVPIGYEVIAWMEFPKPYKVRP